MTCIRCKRPGPQSRIGGVCQSCYRTGENKAYKLMVRGQPLFDSDYQAKPHQKGKDNKIARAFN